MNTTTSEIPPPSESWGISDDELATAETVFRPDLFSGQNFLVSGGGSGMGLATALLVARLGANVMICGRSEEKLQRASDNISRLTGREVAWKAMTIRDPEQVDALMDEAFARFGHIDTLVNSAGGQFSQHALDLTVKGWNAVIDTNLNGTFWMMQAAGRRWRDSGRPGSIVSIVATFERGSPQVAHSAAARAGIVFLSHSLAVEWAPLNIRVNCISPGNTEVEGRFDKYDSEYRRRFTQSNPMRKAGDTLDIAQAVAYVSAPSGKFITGMLMHVNGGMHLWGTTWPLGVPDHFKVG